TVILSQDGELIRNAGSCWESATEVCDNIAWQYYKDFIETPIKNHLNSTYNQNGVLLKNIIRYIVICKGLPHKVRSGHVWVGTYGEWAHRTRINVSIDALLCLMNNTQDILTLYNNPATPVQPPLPDGIFSSDPVGGNPYYNVDPTFNLNHRFNTNHYITGTGWKLNYLVSRLDGQNLTEVQLMIDRLYNSDHSGTGTWILDGGLSLMYDDVLATNNKLTSLGFNTVVDYNRFTWISQNSSPVMGYTSAGFNDGMPSSYIHTLLDFDYQEGAIFNTFESFNAWAMNKVFRNWHGLVSEFVERRQDGQAGGGGAGHTFEPFAFCVSKDSTYFPAYAIGYSMVDAAYQGMRYLGWQNLVIGDPLTTIAWGRQSLTTDLNWSGTNLVTGEVNILPFKTLTIANNSIINLKHQGFITGEGELVIGQNVTFNIYSWQKGLFLSYDSDHPRIVWGRHLPLDVIVNYKVYRKINSTGTWSLIATTTALEYTDNQMLLEEPLPGELPPNLFYKVLAYTELPATDESNTVFCRGTKYPKKESVQQNPGFPLEYSLSQNYPNPFNPTTQINYSIKEAGLVQLRVYDILGKEIANLVNENKEAGFYSIEFDASQLSSGLYIYQLTTTGFTQARKMMLTK
ncbi:MAG: T9SS type A sorting domain-containing protein, partial [Ignavibacteria bacterium]|nr:T9SS type A sorting domain-containing protein [Ignavibacteria bacterium]